MKKKRQGSNYLTRACSFAVVSLASIQATCLASSNMSFYDILGVDRGATQQQIKKAYRRKALLSHPDKNNGDRTEFDAVREAYDCLNDEEKRKVYDRYGKDGVNMNMPGGAAASDIFRSFFYGGRDGSASSASGAQRQRSMRYQLEVTLEDLYKGLDRDITIAQPGLPGGNKKVHVYIDRGSFDGQRIVLPGEIDHIPNAVPADVIFILSQRPHKTFSRKGDDLAIKLSISLDEAISGFERRIKHLDGRFVTIVLEASESKESPLMKKEGSIRFVKGCGMPKRGRPGKYGDLYVEFDIRLPSTFSRLNDEEHKQLAYLLRKAAGKDKEKVTSSDEDEQERVYLKPCSASSFGKNYDHGYHDEQMHTDHEEFEHDHDNPFAHAFGGNSFRSFSYSNFGNGGDDNSNVQCQQM